MSTHDEIEQACIDLAAGRALDPEAGRRVAELAKAMAATDAGVALLKRRAILERDRLLLKLAAQHFAGLHSVRATARAILTKARRYETSGWLRDRNAVTNPRPPESIAGMVWAVLKAWPDLPSERRLHDLLSNPDV